MCYAYYREQSAARKDSTETPATPPRETETPVAPAVGGKLAEEKAFSSFIDKVQHLLAAQKRRETTPV